MRETPHIDDLVIEDLTESAAGNCFGTLGCATCPASFGTLGSFT
ncbi:hypothetical protein Ssi03_48890 [Sphaerisporangium siamense]|uniref:Thiocillin family RiPP n=1 Tax=Sphaerisporangium siamense TaxID=795645 RepID=A0A7W7D5X5_9ACTN|nr:hypothetical protein [Sphaerisporangium siamense]MBB4699486.1 hypothetical protein [Sphaerisporangium siamense]GII86899.1 hypothetical protein Ssi03_48890 [Sphaerisporangium siamense]